MMNAQNMGGASRPRRRRVLEVSSLIFIGAVLLLSIRESGAEMPTNIFDEQQPRSSQPDSIHARHLLDAVRGANGVLCGAIDRSFDTGYWGNSMGSIMETEFSDRRSTDIGQWIGHRKFDETVYPMARAALSSSDACERRIAARILGNLRNRERLHEQLRSELTASDSRTKTAALFALGFADSHQAIPAIRERLSDADRNVRVAAIWALANIGDRSISETLISLLQRDGDPVVRGAAAWALGRLND
jgi:hypothetical protein